MPERTIGQVVSSRVRTVLAVIAVGAVLAGCFRVPAPAPVSYPDDPRVLHGQWQVTVTGLSGGPVSFVHAERANRLVMWSAGSARVFDFQQGSGWHEEPAGPLADTFAGEFDPALEAFVTVTRGAGNVGIRVVPAAGTAVVEHNVELPAGHALEDVAVGSGRVFALTRVTGGAWHLSWWDAVSAELGGSRSVPAPRDGMRVSSNGRTLALWDLNAWAVTVVDTAAPQSQVGVRLGACRSNGLSEASPDGRWFLVSDCMNNIRAADLSEQSPATSAVGVRHTSLVTFAAQGGEFVWRDTQGVMRAYDLENRTREELGRLEVEAPEYLDPWVRAVYLNRAAGLFVYGTAYGTLLVNSVPPGANTVVEAELPPMALTGALLDLQADPVAASGADSYEFSGSFEAVGAGVSGERLPIAGSVYAHGLHDYRPGLAPQVWIPRLVGNAEVMDGTSDVQRYALAFSTVDRHGSVYRGQLWDVSDGTGYSVTLERTGGE